MRSSSTRLLLLGAVGLFEPVNGYQIRRELISWEAHKWANLNPGSVYHGLNSLAADGLLRRQDLVDGTRDVAVYELTEAGRAELDRLLAASITEVDLFDQRDFQAAFALLPMIGDDRARELLSERHQRFAVILADLPLAAPPDDQRYIPPHALRFRELTARSAHLEFDWLTGVLDDLRAGRLVIGPDGAWVPPADDPAHEMTADRARYRALIDGDTVPSGSGTPATSE